MEAFARLPEGCISEILSFTSPLDTSRSSVTSKLFKFAAESDHIWLRFLPPDFQEILSTSVSPLKYATIKDLYFTLSHSPLLIHGGKMSFSLDKKNGKKCFMVGASELVISWKGCWDFTSHVKSRFSEVATLRSIGWIYIQGRIKTEILSKNTSYAAYLVFWLEEMDGLRSSNTLIRFINENNTRNESRSTGNIARKRRDGWMEIEMGKFYIGCEEDDDGEIEAWLIEVNSHNVKSGLIVEGIEFRPL